MKLKTNLQASSSHSFAGETVDKMYSCSKAADVRDAMAKALYARLFQWMVSRLNSYLQPPSRAEHLHIGAYLTGLIPRMSKPLMCICTPLTSL